MAAPSARIACGTMCTQWPDSSCSKPLSDMSKANEAFNATAERGASMACVLRAICCQKFTAERCSTITPLALPVEPEV
ncbi:hypothetical protein ASD58_30015 [Duganella sp. Root1480D1]|nr:hypothetical protein ASD58_30015 [Duganella sp. Root1480D1]